MKSNDQGFCMNPDNPFEEILNQINDLLQIVADNAEKPLKNELPPDLDSKLSKLEKQVEEFRRISNSYISKLGVTNEDMEAYLKKVAQSSNKKTQKITERTRQLTEEIEKKKEILEKQKHPQTLHEHAQVEDISLSEKKQLQNKSPQARKSLFKRIGGNKKWRPL